MALSEKAKSAIKTAFAMTLVYAIALWMDWEEPKWAGFCVAVLSAQAMGENLNKGVNRVLGSTLGVVMSFVMVSLFAQERWEFIMFLATWFMICYYGFTGTRFQHFWFVSAQVSLVISVDSAMIPEEAFWYGALRVQETLMGMVVYSLVMVLLWPRNSRGAFSSSALDLIRTQSALFSAMQPLFAGAGDNSAMMGLRQQELSGLASFRSTMIAAISDTDEVREVAKQWRRYHDLNSALAEAMQRARDTATDLQSARIGELVPQLEAFSAEQEQRFGAIEALLNNQSPHFGCRDVPVAVPDANTPGLSELQRAAAIEFVHQLKQIDGLTRDMVAVLGDIRGVKGKASVLPVLSQRRSGFVPDQDRLVSAVKAFVMIWLAFLMVIYVPDVPADFVTIILIGAIGLNLLSQPQVPVRNLYKPVFIAITLPGLLYMLVMPSLSGFTGLAVLIFATTFFFCYTFSQPTQFIARVLGLICFTAIIDVSNTEQQYSFLQVALTGLSFLIVIWFHQVFSWIPFSPLPERALLRRTRRFFSSAATLLDRDVPTTGALEDSLGLRYHRNEVTTLPDKMAPWIPRASAELGPAAAEEVPLLIARLRILSYRFRVLEEARALPLSSPVQPSLLEKFEAWRAQTVSALRELANEPTAIRGVEAVSLKQHLASLQVEVGNALGETDFAVAGELDRINLYVRFSAYRGVSQALQDFLDAAGTVSFEAWYQERFV